MKTNELYVSQDFHENVYVEASESNNGQAHQNASLESSEKPQEKIVKTLSTNRYRIAVILSCVIVFTGFALAIAALVRAGNERNIEERTENLLYSMQEQLDELKEETNRLQIANNKQKMRINELEGEQRYFESCEEAFKHTNDTSGFYMISPKNDLHHSEVYCSSTNNSVETVFYHNFPYEVDAGDCEKRRCAKHKVKYDTKLGIMRILIERLSDCRQFIKYRCIHSRMFGEKNTYAAWLSRDGTPQTYWGGATESGHCACGEAMRKNCRDNTHNCNCDSNTDTQTSDEGFLTDKDKLPVTELQFGELSNSSSGVDERGWFTLGPLICSN